MHARIATFENIDPNMEQPVMQFLRERGLPAIKQLDGFKGSLTLVDRENRKALGITLFDSEGAVRAAEPTFESLPAEMPQEVRAAATGTRTAVEVYEVVVQEGLGG